MAFHFRNCWQAVLVEDWQNGGFGVYIHWPFCEAKCPYCDFNSHVSKKVDQEIWLTEYLSDIERYASETGSRPLTSIFFGGGTPSLMEPAVVEKIIDRIVNYWPASNSLEITLEANPSSVESQKFRDFAHAGVNRISMGFQALNDRDLTRLGRIHSTSDSLAALEIANANFGRVSFDLIYGRQDQTPENWEKELRFALSIATEHISLYQLTIEDGTAFGDRYKRGKLRGLPDEDRAVDLFNLTQDVCAETGFSSYEVSNYSKIGSESKHNLIYWKYGDYVGIGPGAHGRLTLNGTKHATEAWSNPSKWLSHHEKERTALTPTEQVEEFLMMGLRLTDGIDPKRLKTLSNKPLNSEKIAHLKDLGLISTNGNIRTTKSGRLLLNEIIRELLL